MSQKSIFGAIGGLLFALALIPNANAYWHKDWHKGWHSDWGHHAPAYISRHSLPNPALTPGALNPEVTQSDIKQTICRRGWTRTVRPPEAYTERLKRIDIRKYGYVNHKIWQYELDHLVSLELGGSPTSPQNLWPEPHNSVGGWGSYAKDRLENRLNDLVCSGRLSLASAQRQIAQNWIQAYIRYIGPTPNNTIQRRYR
jgi:hypothetical protein